VPRCRSKGSSLRRCGAYAQCGLVQLRSSCISGRTSDGEPQTAFKRFLLPDELFLSGQRLGKMSSLRRMTGACIVETNKLTLNISLNIFQESVGITGGASMSEEMSFEGEVRIWRWGRRLVAACQSYAAITESNRPWHFERQR
jgi:hypothetical protein